MPILFQVASATFALAAGVLWLRASLVKSPEKLTAITWNDTGPEGDLPNLFQAVSAQSLWNVRASICASFAAFCQVVTVAADIYSRS
jgi:hypothetical protein